MNFNYRILMVAVILQITSLSLAEEEEVVYYCRWTEAKNSCKFIGAYYLNRSETFNIAVSVYSSEEYDAVRVKLVENEFNNCRFYFMPMEIFRYFPNIEVLDFVFVHMMEIDEPFSNCKSLKEILLRGNKLTSIGKVFDECTALTYLELSENLITSIHDDAMKRLINLEKFEIAENYELEELPNNFFDGNQKLYIINIAATGLKSVPKELLGNVTSLTWLIASSNPYPSPHDISTCLNKLTSMETLDLGNSNIFEIVEGTFSGLAELLELSLSGNQINFLHHKCFEPLTKLETLFLSYNKIAKIDARLFQPLENAQKISLQDNNIEDIEVGTFVGLDKLESLDLSNNQINFLHYKCFESLAKLATLFLSGNQIVQIDARLFQPLKNAHGIFLQDNKIEDLEVGAFVGLDKLDNLDLSTNQFTRLRMASFGILPQLSTLILSYNNLTHRMSSKFFENFPKLQFLSVYDVTCAEGYYGSSQLKNSNVFQNCYANVLHCIYSESLYGDTCEIIDLDLKMGEDIFMIDGNNPRENIQYVHASNSVIEFVPQIILDEFTQLSRLELNNVGMKELKKLRNCSFLVVLSLEDNELHFIPYRGLEFCANLQEIYLSGNGFNQLLDDAFWALNYLNILHIENSLSKIPESEFSGFLGIGNDFRQNAGLMELFLSLKLPFIIFEGCWFFSPHIVKLKMEGYMKLNITNFDYLSELESLSLAGNGLSWIEELVFEPLISLKHLDLSHNQLNSSLLVLNSLSSNLTTLILDYNNFDDMPIMANNLIKLIELSVANNQIKTLESVFEFPSLKVLNLKDNQIASIHHSVFEHLQNLETLELSGNLCSQQDFYNISDVASQVDLYQHLRNCLNNFEPCIFADTKHGYSCKLVMGQSMSEDDIRKHLEGRIDANVQSVQLKFMPLKVDLNLIIAKFDFLLKIELWKNSIDNLAALGNCPNLVSFDLRMNKIGRLHNKFLANCTQLSKLILLKNEISDVSMVVFDDLTNLQHLDLSFNEIEDFPNLKTTTLKTLKLSHNKIKSIDWVATLFGLTIFDLSYNSITSIDFAVFSDLTHLKEIHLNNNQIAEILPLNSKSLQSLIYLNLAANRFDRLVIFEQPQYLDLSDNNILTIDFEFSKQLYV